MSYGEGKIKPYDTLQGYMMNTVCPFLSHSILKNNCYCLEKKQIHILESYIPEFTCCRLLLLSLDFM